MGPIISAGCSAAHGHDVRLMSPEYVRPYVKAQKNDDRDAEGIAEAATRPTMRFVEVKSEAQLDMQTLHRSRDRLVGERTALIALSLIVVFIRFPRTTPCRPMALMSRATVHRATAMPSRVNCLQTLRTP